MGTESPTVSLFLHFLPPERRLSGFIYLVIYEETQPGERRPEFTWTCFLIVEKRGLSKADPRVLLTLSNCCVDPLPQVRSPVLVLALTFTLAIK